MHLNRILFLAFDHIFLGLLPGIEDIERKIVATLPAKPDGMILNYGVLRQLGPAIASAGVAPILRLDGNRSYLAGEWTKLPEWEMFYTAECAVKAGAQAAIVNLLVGGPSELASIKVVAKAAAGCQEADIPLVVSAIALSSMPPWRRHRTDERRSRTIFAARLAYELGASIVNVYSVADPSIVQEILPLISVPAVISGGPGPGRLAELTHWVAGALSKGAAGICVGKAVWQDSEPDKIALELRSALDNPMDFYPSEVEQ